MEHALALALPLLVATYLFWVAQSWMDSRDRARRERVQLLEQAVCNPSIERATIEGLAVRLTSGAAAPERARGSMAVVLASGWLALFAGAGAWVLGDFSRQPTVTAAGIAASVIGLGLVPCPFALRVLETRKAES